MVRFAAIATVLTVVMMGRVHAQEPAQGSQAAPPPPELPIADMPFVQEYREFLPSTGIAAGDDVRGMSLDGRGRLWTATADGVWLWNGVQWQAVAAGSERGPAYAVQSDAQGRVWIGSWDGLYRSVGEDSLEPILTGVGPVSVVYGVEEIIAAGPDGLWSVETDDSITPFSLGGIQSPRSIAPAAEEDSYWIGTDVGLFLVKLPEASPVTPVEIVRHVYAEPELGSVNVKALNGEFQDFLFIGGSEGIDIYQNGQRAGRLDASNGLPFRQIAALEISPYTTGVPTPYFFGTYEFDTDPATFAEVPAVTLWIATPQGAVRFLIQRWSVLHGERWLPSDDVRCFAFDGEANTYVGTAAGISVIRRRMMTLGEKAAYFHQIVRERKVRVPGLVEKTRLLTPGDVATSMHEDDDNDGEYTAQYLMMEAYRYQATQDPEARRFAQEAYEALEFLQTVTGTPGFVARTVVPVEWGAPDNPNPHRFHDRNRTYIAQEVADLAVYNPRFKPVEERWRLSEDGNWYWKGDTSSDEMVGHFCAYLIYHELVAESPEEKARVARHTARIMDYIIDGGLELRDIDGTSTRWGVWSPEKLLQPGEWQAERHINAAEILSFLLVTHHLTDDPKYLEIYDDLVENHGYLRLARAPQSEHPDYFTHIDSILLVKVFPGLLMTKGRPEHRENYRAGLNQWFPYVRDEFSPFYNFTYGVYGEDDARIAEAVSFLRDAPLDLIRWTVDNRNRDDVGLVREPERDHLQTDRMLPPSERGITRWDDNPWSAIQGDGGRTESSGVYWLLPYWMGRYHGFIAAPGE